MNTFCLERFCFVGQIERHNLSGCFFCFCIWLQSHLHSAAIATRRLKQNKDCSSFVWNESVKSVFTHFSGSALNSKCLHTSSLRLTYIGCHGVGIICHVLCWHQLSCSCFCVVWIQLLGVEWVDGRVRDFCLSICLLVLFWHQMKSGGKPISFARA